MAKLFRPLQLGRIGHLTHRVVLAPLTRNRASEPSLSPSALTVQYYRQRASAGGLLISEATNISPESLAYPSTPGIWNQEHVDAWRKVTDAVHEKGGYIVCQLWHTGRVAHSSYASHPAAQAYASETNQARIPGVSASTVPITNRHGKPGKTLTYNGVTDCDIPRALGADEIPRLLEDYRHAARNAMAAGFDGVEVHAAHGYLIDQFLNNGVNQRDDQYGGSTRNRCRLLREVLAAIFDVIPSSKVGVRLSPHESPNGGNTYYGCKDSNPDAVYTEAIKMLNTCNLAYLLMTEPRWVGRYDASPETDPGFQMPLVNLQKFRRLYNGLLMGAGGFTPRTMENDYDLLAFGRWFLANPDLPERLRLYHDHQQGGLVEPPALNLYERDSFYTQDAEGYVDYPSLDAETKDRKEHDGMVTGKYALVEQEDVGTSLKAIKSKL